MGFVGIQAVSGDNALETTPIVRVELDPSFQCAVLYVAGYLDELTTPRFRGALYDVIGRGYRDIIIELGETEGISSVGLGALVCGIRRFNGERGRIVLAHARPSLDRCLRLAGAPDLFPMYPTLEEARAALFQLVTQVLEPVKENSARLRTWLKSATAALDISATEREAIEAAVSEAFTNAVQHAAPGKTSLVTVRLVLGSSVVIEVQDRGPGFEARQYFTVDPDALHTGARGLGIHVMRNLMDQVEFIAGASGTTDSPAGTTVRLVKRLSPPSSRTQPSNRKSAAAS